MREKPGSVQRVSSSLQTAQMRAGDFRLPGDSRNRWGRIELLASRAGESGRAQQRRTAPFVETPSLQQPEQFLIELRGQTPAGVWSTVLPDFGPGNEYTLTVKIRRAVDREKGVVEDVYVIGPGATTGLLSLPVTNVQAQQLAIYVEIASNVPATNVQLTVEVVVSITCNSCDSPRGTYTSSVITRPVQSATTALFLPAAGRRRQFLVQNWGSSPLYVAFSDSAALPGSSSPKWTVALPSQGDIYESFGTDGYDGPVAGVWETDDAAGYAMVTAGQ